MNLSELIQQGKTIQELLELYDIFDSGDVGRIQNERDLGKWVSVEALKQFSNEHIFVPRKQLEKIRDYIEAHQARVGFYGKGLYDLTVWLLGNLPLETFYADHIEDKKDVLSLEEKETPKP